MENERARAAPDLPDNISLREVRFPTRMKKIDLPKSKATRED